MKSKTAKYLFFAFCSALPISQLVSSRILFVAVILSFFLSSQRFSSSKFFHQSWDLFLFFLILLIGLIYSSDLDLGLRHLETNLSFIGVPIVIYNLSPFSKDKLDQTYYSFTAGAILASIICLTFAFVDYFESGSLQVFFYSKLTNPIDSHPTYFAYYLIFAITYGLYLLYYELPPRYFFWMIALLIFLFLMLLLTGGQTSFISILLTFAFFISKYLLEKKTKRVSLTIGLVAFFLFCMIGLIMAFQNSKLLLPLSNQNDYWERMMLWESAIKANTNPLLGVGTGDYNLVLNAYYQKHGLADFATKNFNSHNQFIQSFFTHGLLGLAGLILLLGRPLYLSVKNQNLLGILVFFPFLVYGITEVFLGRYQGVVFLALLHQVFISHYLHTEVYSLKVSKL